MLHILYIHCALCPAYSARVAVLACHAVVQQHVAAVLQLIDTPNT
jgi:hypothetical protein